MTRRVTYTVKFVTRVIALKFFSALFVQKRSLFLNDTLEIDSNAKLKCVLWTVISHKKENALWNLYCSHINHWQIKILLIPSLVACIDGWHFFLLHHSHHKSASASMLASKFHWILNWYKRVNTNVNAEVGCEGALGVSGTQSGKPWIRHC